MSLGLKTINRGVVLVSRSTGIAQAEHFAIPEPLSPRTRRGRSSSAMSSLGRARNAPADRRPRKLSDAGTDLLGDTAWRRLGTGGRPPTVRSNGAAYLHEHVVSKYCTVLGISLTAVIAYEDGE